MRIFKSLIFAVTILWSLDAFSQNKQEGGMIVFEGQQNMFELYFIKTSTRNIASLLNKNDTITAVLLGTPGDDASNNDDFKRYLNETIRFDTVSLTINQKNHLGQEYEERAILLSKYGFIQYHQGKSYKLAKRYKKLYLNKRIIIIALEEFIPINSFTSKAAKVK